MLYQNLFYDYTLFSKTPLDIKKYTTLIGLIKNHLAFQKIIYEKTPKIIDRIISIDRDRMVSEQNDHLIIFAIGQPSSISTIWYRDFDKIKHVSIYNGKCLIIPPQTGDFQIKVKQNDLHLFSSVICNFEHYNILRYNHQHSIENFNLSTRFNIL